MTNLLTDIAETEPASFVAGDTVIWKRTDLHDDYPVASYALSYTARLEGSGSTNFSATASEDSTGYTVTLAAATTAGFTTGVYRWQAYITRASDSARVTVDDGRFEVLANRSTSTADPRSHAKIMLDKIESILQGRADADVATYTINGRSLTKLTIEELMMWRDRYRAEYRAEQRAEKIANGDGVASKIVVRF